MAIFSRRYWDEGLRLPPALSSVTEYPASKAHLLKIEEYIKARLGVKAPSGKRKLIELEMGDAWSNGVSLSWLLESLRRYGNVTTVLKLNRNILRQLLVSEAVRRFGPDASLAMTCAQQMHLYAMEARQ
eukprot:gene6113-7804_t